MTEEHLGQNNKLYYINVLFFKTTINIKLNITEIKIVSEKLQAL